MDTIIAEMDLDYGRRFPHTVIPDACELSGGGRAGGREEGRVVQCVSGSRSAIPLLYARHHPRGMCSGGSNRRLLQDRGRRCGWRGHALKHFLIRNSSTCILQTPS